MPLHPEVPTVGGVGQMSGYHNPGEADCGTVAADARKLSVYKSDRPVGSLENAHDGFD